MVRRNVISLFIFFSIASNASAQTCAGNPVAVQILGSGGPAINTERASASVVTQKGAFVRPGSGPVRPRPAVRDRAALGIVSCRT